MKEKSLFKNIKVTLISLLVIISFGVYCHGQYEKGFQDGAEDVLANQIITNECHDEDFYYSKYKNRTYKYWYEKWTFNSIAILEEENLICL